MLLAEGDRGLKLYSQSDFNLISQLREHCADKTKSRESFVPNSNIEVLDIETQVTKLQIKSRKGHSCVRMQSRVKSFYEDAIDFGLNQDPLFDLELLQRISDRNYLLPATRLAPILNITAKYLNSKKEYYYCGFLRLVCCNVCRLPFPSSC
jgi:hypothetical protein